MNDDQRGEGVDNKPEDEDVEAHRTARTSAAEEQGDDADGDDDFELHRTALGK